LRVRRFRFRHEAILRLRHHAEDTVRNELLAARGRYLREERARERARARRARYARELSGETRRVINADEIDIAEGHLAGLSAEIAGRGKAMQRIGEEIAEIGVRLTEAMRERKIMEKLRDKAEAAHRKQENRKEQSAIDETSARRRMLWDPRTAQAGGGM
jgi:flagellar FliJ protein